MNVHNCRSPLLFGCRNETTFDLAMKVSRLRSSWVQVTCVYSVASGLPSPESIQEVSQSFPAGQPWQCKLSNSSLFSLCEAKRQAQYDKYFINVWTASEFPPYEKITRKIYESILMRELLTEKMHPSHSSPASLSGLGTFSRLRWVPREGGVGTFFSSHKVCAGTKPSCPQHFSHPGKKASIVIFSLIYIPLRKFLLFFPSTT